MLCKESGMNAACYLFKFLKQFTELCATTAIIYIYIYIYIYEKVKNVQVLLTISYNH